MYYFVTDFVTDWTNFKVYLEIENPDDADKLQCALDHIGGFYLRLG